MISYDGYLNRIQKLAKIKNVIHRFRFLIIGVFSLIVAAGTGLLMAKGAVTTQMSLPAEIVFGEAYAPTPASAFLSSVSYEYALDDGSNEWSSVQPVKAGKYLARTVTKKTFGNGYGKTIHFEILPRPATFSIGATSVTYGDVPTNCKVSDLLPGQNLVTDDLLFEYESYTLGPTQIDVVPSSVKIVDSTGEDYTSCYAITYNGKVLRVDPRKITVAPASWNHTYDGEAVPLKNELASDTLAKLAYGDTISGIKYAFVGDGVIKNKGEYAVTLNDDYTIMHGEIDVTALYKREEGQGTLTIDPRPITITTGSASREYNGEPLSTNGKTPDIGGDGLVSGHTLAVFKTAEITNVAKNVTNTIEELVIKDGDGTPVTDNYQITPNYGTLTINKRKIILAPNADVTLVYNGKDRDATVADEDLSDITKSYHISEQGVREAALVSGHRFVGEKYTIKNVGEVLNGFEYYTIYDSEIQTPEHDVTRNYDIDQSQLGTLTITKRKIIITSDGGTWEYDGTEHSAPIIDSDLKNHDKSYHINEEHEKEDALVSGHVFVGQVWKIKNVGERPNGFEYYTIYDSEIQTPEHDVTRNYDIDQSQMGTLTVYKRRIVIENRGDSKAYDGKALTCEEYTTKHYISPGVSEGQGLIGDNITNKYILMLIGDPASITNFKAGGTKNANRYRDTSGNYEIMVDEYVDGTLTIEKRKIVITNLGDTREYNGTALTCTDYTTKYYLPNGDENGSHLGLINESDKQYLALDGEAVSVTNVLDGVKANNNTYKVINTDNYVIDHYENNGTLTVTKRKIVVTNLGTERVYNGKAWSYTEYRTEHAGGPDDSGDSRGLLNGETLTPTYTVTIGPDVGVSKQNANRYNDLDNYHIVRHVDEGYLTITPKPLKITLINLDDVIYGEPLSYPTGRNGETYASVEGLVNNDTIHETIEVGVEFYTSQGEKIDGNPRNAGEDYEIRFNRGGTKIYDSAGKLIENGLDNYDLQEPVVSTYATIAKKDVTVVCDTTNIAYGQGFMSPTPHLNPLPLPYGDSITVRFKYSLDGVEVDRDKLPHAGTYKVEIDRCEGTENGQQINGEPKNYNLTLAGDPTVIVSSKNINIKLLDCEIEYGDTPTYPTGEGNYKIVVSDPLVDGDYLEVIGATFALSKEYPDFGTYENVIIVPDKENGALIKDRNGQPKEALDYDITFTPGTLKINPKPVTVTLSQNLEMSYGDNIPEVEIETDITIPGQEFALTNYHFEQGSQKFNKSDILHKGAYDICADKEDLSVGGGGSRDNYDITILPGKLTVNARKLTVTLDDVTAEYGDTEALENLPNKYEITGGDGLVNGDKLNITVKIDLSAWSVDPARPNARTYEGAVAVVKDSATITGGKGNIGDYAIEYENGNLEITPRPILVINQGASKDYDGTEVTPPAPITKYNGIDESGSKSGLVYGDELSPDRYNAKTPHVINVWQDEVPNTTQYLQNDNYIITYDEHPGVLKIIPRKLFVTIKNPLEKTYDRRAVDVKDVVSASNLAPDETFEAVIYFQDEEGNICNGPFNVGTYTIILNKEESRIKKKGVVIDKRDIENYAIQPDNPTGTLEIKQKQVTVTLDNITITYGEALPEVSEVTFKTNCDLPTFTEGQEEKQEKFVLKGYYIKKAGQPVGEDEIFHVGVDYEVWADDGDIVGFDANTNLSNYEITIKSGELKVKARPLTVQLNNIDAVYGDEKTLNNPPHDYEITGDDDLVNGDSLDITTKIDFDKCPNKPVYPDKPGVGTYEGAVVEDKDSVKITGKGYNDDYDIHFLHGDLEITAKPISIELSAPDEDTYIYGETYDYPEKENNFVCEGVTAYGETIKVAVYYVLKGTDERVYEHKNVNEYEVVFDRAHTIVYDSENREVPNGIGNYDVGEVERVSFEIEKRQLLITIGRSTYECVYGDTLPEVTYSTEGILPYGEHFTTKFLYELGGEYYDQPRNFGTYNIVENVAERRINGEKEGVANYDFKFTNSATLKIAKRHIRVTFSSKSRPYNGEWLSGEDKDITAKYGEDDGFVYVYGDHAEAVSGDYPKALHFTETPVENIFEFRIVNENGDDVTYNYEFTDDDITPGMLTITPKEVRGTIRGESIIYGEELPTAFEVDINPYYALVSGDEIKITEHRFDFGSKKDGIHPDAGTHDIVMNEYEIIGKGERADYNVTIYDGTLTVTVRQLVIQSASPEPWVYDGLVHSSPAADASQSYYINANGDEASPAIVPGQRFEGIGCTEIQDVGKVENGFADFEVYAENGENVKTNYAVVEYKNGWLEITKRVIVIGVDGGQWEYDGEYHSAPIADRYLKDSTKSYHDNNGVHEAALVLGHYFQGVGYPEVKNVVKDVKEGIPNDFDDKNSKIFDSAGKDVTGNYTITKGEMGKLIITPRPILVINQGASKEYDGTALEHTDPVTKYYNGIDESGSKPGLVGGDGLIPDPDNTTRVTNVWQGKVPNTTQYLQNDNYKITYDENSGTLEIIPRKLYVTLKDVPKIYNRLAIDDETYIDSFSVSHIVTGEHLRAAFTYERNGEPYTGPFNVGTYTIVFDEKNSWIEKDEEPFDERDIENYDIRLTNSGAILTITPLIKSFDLENIEAFYGTDIADIRPVEFETEFVLLLFDGGQESFKLTGYHFEKDGQPVEKGKFLDAGDYQICADKNEMSPLGDTNLDNYIITFNGMLTVKPRPLTIVLSDFEDTLPDSDIPSYPYGKEPSYPAHVGNYKGITGEFGGLVGDDTLEIAVYYVDKDGKKYYPGARLNAGVYDVELDIENCKINGEQGVKNYTLELDKEPVIVEIIKLKLTIKFTDEPDPENPIVFDNNEHEYPAEKFEIVDGQTAYGEVLKIAVKYFDENGNEVEAPKNAGTYKVTLDTDNCTIAGSGMDANINYILHCENEFEFTISPKKVVVQLPEYFERTYRGEKLGPEEFTNDFPVKTLPGGRLKYEVTYTQNGEPVEPRNAGDYEVSIDWDTGVEVVDGIPSNYIITSEGGNTCPLYIKKRPIQITVHDRGEIEYFVEIDPQDAEWEAKRLIGGVPMANDAFASDAEKDEAGLNFYYLDKDNKRFDVPTALGEYTIWVEFTNKELEKNYDMTCIPGKLNIVGRKVRVTPSYNDEEEYVYNGEKIDAEDLISKLKFTNKHDVEGSSGYEYGFAEDDVEGLIINCTVTKDDDKSATTPGEEDYCIRIKITGCDENGVMTVSFIEESGRLENKPRNAGTYRIKITITGYSEDAYKVQCDETEFIIKQKPLSVQRIGKREWNYNKKAPDNIVIEPLSGEGLVPSDQGTCEVVPLYYYVTEKGEEIRIDDENYVYNVGTYKIGAKVDDPSDADNYEIKYEGGERGTLVITPVTLFIKPKSKTELYNGKEITLTQTDWECVANSPSGQVAQGDEIRAMLSTYTLDPTKKTKVSVYITDCKVVDEITREDMKDMSGNYIIYYSYDMLPDDMLSDYRAKDFKGTLSYQLRTIRYNLVVPSGQDKIPYDGQEHEITASGSADNLYNIVGGVGLAQGDHIEVKDATIGPQVGDYADWLRLCVKNEAGKDVSRVYNLVLMNEEESTISITALPVTVTVKSALTQAILDNGDAFYKDEDAPVSFEGRKVLSKDYYTLTGTQRDDINLNPKYAVVAIKSSGKWNFAIVIYETKEGSSTLIDMSEYYKIGPVTYEGAALDAEWQIVDCHLLSIIKSDITLTLKVGYDELERIADGNGGTPYKERSALSPGQYEIEGLLPGHESPAVVVIRSNGKLTLGVIVFSGKSNKGEYYNVNEIKWDVSTTSEDVVAMAVSGPNDIPQDVTITFSGLTPANIESGDAFETVDGRLALKERYYKDNVSGLITDSHQVRIIPIMAGDKVTFEVLIYEDGKPGSSRTYLYNLFHTEGLPDGVEIELAESLSTICPQVKIHFTTGLAQTLHGGSGTTASKIDGRRVLTEDMFYIDKCFGGSPLLEDHDIEIVVDIDKDTNKITLYVVIYQWKETTQKRSIKSQQYIIDYEGAVGVNVVIQEAPLGNEGL